MDMRAVLDGLDERHHRAACIGWAVVTALLSVAFDVLLRVLVR